MRCKYHFSAIKDQSFLVSDSTLTQVVNHLILIQMAPRLSRKTYYAHITD